MVTLFLGNLVVLSVLPELTRADPSYWALAVPLLGAFALSPFVLLPLVVPGLLKGSLGPSDWSSSAMSLAVQPCRQRQRKETV